MKSFLVKSCAFKLFAVFLILTSALAVSAVSGDVDPAFNPKLTIDLVNIGGNMAIQPDGKILVFGSYTISGGSSIRTFIKRLNPDSSIDPTFDCPVCRGFILTSASFQPDGKIIIGTTTGIIRITQNGSLDASFAPPFNSELRCNAKQIIIQPDGKSLIACKHEESSSNPKEFVIRLNTDGSEDTSFARINLQSNYPPQIISEMVLSPDGKLLIGGGYYIENGGWLKRYDSNGNLDNTFQASVTSAIRAIALSSDGKYLVAGGFASSQITKLSATGSVEASFATGQNTATTGIKPLSNGQFYVQLYTSPFPAPGPNVGRFVRYNANGSVDNTFSQTFLDPGRWAVDGSDRIVTSKAGYYRLNFDGTVDSSFNPSISTEGFARTADLQSDGKIVVTGEFGKANGFNAVRIARLNSDGTTDTSFNPGSGFNVPPTAVKSQSDGKILVGGRFSFYNGSPQSGLIRLNADGSLDTTFNTALTGNATAWQVEKILILPGGKILVGGGFTTVNGTPRQALARLNPDGSLDTSFTPPLTGSTIEVLSVYLQSNGQIMAGGNFGLIRMNSDGSLDSSFNAQGVGSGISDILQRADGKYIISFKPISVYFGTVYLLNDNGTRSSGFQPPTMTTSGSVMINTIFQQSNGNIVFGGAFSTVSLRASGNIARISPTGKSDIFFPQIGTNGAVNKIIGQPDEKILFVGDFSGIEDVGRSGIARLTLSSRISGTLFDFDGDGRADISVFRPSTNTWYSLLSNGSYGIQNFGAAGDIPTPADYDGDGKTDLGIFRPSTGNWIYLSSQTNTINQFNWGTVGDIPLPSDVTADGKADFVLYRPSNNTWYQNPGSTLGPFGIAGDKPVVGDFDGDGKADIAVYRPSTGTWWYAATGSGYAHRAAQWGIAEDIPVPADYDGDGKTDFAVFRPSNGGWYVLKSTGGYLMLQFGLAGDKPVSADYDGDGKADIGVYRPSTGEWYLLQSTAGFSGAQWGISTDIPVQNAFIH